MGAWMDQQLIIGDFSPPKSSESEILTENHTIINGEEETIPDYELHPETNSGLLDAAAFEQRRAYKLEFQKGISLFNRKSFKGLEFLISSKKISGSPEKVAAFLKNTAILNKTVIGDCLGEREDFSLRVMHAYVDSFNFEALYFGEAIRFFPTGLQVTWRGTKD